MNPKEIVDRINFGDDVAFECRGRHLVVCPTDEGFSIAERFTCKHAAIFPDGETLINEYRIEGKSIIEIGQITMETC